MRVLALLSLAVAGCVPGLGPGALLPAPPMSSYALSYGSQPEPEVVASRLLDLAPRRVSGSVEYPLGFDAHHVQGLVVTDEAFFVTSVDVPGRRGLLYRVPRNGAAPVELDITEGWRVHPGGMNRGKELLWIPLAEYDADGPTTVLGVDPVTLQTRARFEVDDHLGLVVELADGNLLATDWRSKHWYRFSQDGTVIERVRNHSGVWYQDCARDGATLLCGGWGRFRLTARLDRIDPGDLAVMSKRRIGRARSGYLMTREGLDLHEGRLYFLPADGHAAQVHEMVGLR